VTSFFAAIQSIYMKPGTHFLILDYRKIEKWVPICCAVLLFSFTPLSGQNSNRNHANIIENALKTNPDWILPNPSFVKTKPSFFTGQNTRTIKPFLIFMSHPLAQNLFSALDCENKLIRYLLKNKHLKFGITQGEEAGPPFFGVRISPSHSIKTAIIVNNSIAEGQIISWSHASPEANECPSKYSFFSIKIESEITNWEDVFPIVEYEKNREDDEKVLLGIIFDQQAFPSRLKPAPPHLGILATPQGDSINGTFQDLDSDGIEDVFCYSEKLDEVSSTEYLRLFINVGGSWRCAWSELNEACI
jgi:hypothetical protein